jgi:hypothetical protein
VPERIATARLALVPVARERAGFVVERSDERRVWYALGR